MRSEGTLTRRLALVLTAVACALAAPAATSAAPMDGMPGPHISMQFATFGPNEVTSLAGDDVMWVNDSLRTHTVAADDGSFSSGPVTPSATFTHRYDAPGVYAFHCQIHAGMVGRVDVVRVLLDAITQPAAPNRPLTLTGRAALPAGSKLAIQGDDGTGFRPVATALVGSDGRFRATVTPAATTSFRAVPDGDASGADASPAQQVVVLDRKVRARTSRRGRKVVVTADVTPASPGSTVVLQLKLRDHFGWWPVARKRLDRSSRALFTVKLRHAVPARVVLTQSDGVTPLSDSAALRVGPPRAARHAHAGRRHR